MYAITLPSRRLLDDASEGLLHRLLEAAPHRVHGLGLALTDQRPLDGCEAAPQQADHGVVHDEGLGLGRALP
jgi:hypothetical protein